MKRLLYVLRPLACIAWLEQNDSPPPTLIHETLSGITLPDDVRTRLLELMERKRSMGELGTEPHDLLLDAYIDSEMLRVAETVMALLDVQMEARLMDEILWAEMGI